MSNFKTKGIHKPASRITLADLFGPGPLPTPDEIKSVAQQQKAKTQRRRDPTKPQCPPDRLEAIREAAARTATQPKWARTWHPTARVFVEDRTECRTCGRVHVAPGSAGWLLEFTNSRTGASHTTDPSGPIDKRLPIKKFVHEGHTAVCSYCYLGLVVWPPKTVFQLRLEYKK